jgi:hypothetical protein
MGLNKKNSERGPGRVQAGIAITYKEMQQFYRKARMMEGRSGAAQLAILVREYLKTGKVDTR